jgi:hypothetical protein
MPTDYDDTKRRSWDRALDATPLRHANLPKGTLRMKGTRLMGLSSTGFLVLWSPQYVRSAPSAARIGDVASDQVNDSEEMNHGNG